MSTLTNLQKNGDYNLIMAAILHRHGDRTPVRSHLYPTSLQINNSFFPVGEGALTNAGKYRLYALGKYLRKRYDTLLGKIYCPNEIDVMTSNFDRTKMSVLALCAGLFPPSEEQTWCKELAWQPIPYNAIPSETDIWLDVINPKNVKHFQLYKAGYDDALKSNYVKTLKTRYEEELKFLEIHGGYNNIAISDVYYLYMSLVCEKLLGYETPKWVDQITLERIKEIAVKEYEIMTLTPELKKLCGGGLAHALITELQNKIDGKSNKKFIIYSAHDTTVAYHLKVLNLFDNNQFPDFGAYILWELLEKDNNYYIKVYYQNGGQENPAELLCMKFEEFKNQLAPFFLESIN